MWYTGVIRNSYFMNWEFVIERLWIGTITQQRSETVYPTKTLKNNIIGGPGVIVEIDESKFGKKKIL